ncbi:hypothetical protein JTE90_020219 [Oedothorax gibbosus]|uniref:Uncharacterized protein n=1 Tax=Oedothorax gibbosus TaxID=931172 RepID=A0AAV6UY41_9ARAC|nr:hypothetical protein JTE90_020219 [Oedothorax gibbosus]
MDTVCGVSLLSGSLRTFQVHACDGHDLQIECWPDTVVSVYLAQYGRRVPSHQLCPPEEVTEGTLDMLNDTTDCVATHALRYGRRVPSHQLCPHEEVTEGTLDMLNDTTDCVATHALRYGRRVPSHQLCPTEEVTEGTLDMLNDTTDCVATHALRVGVLLFVRVLFILSPFTPEQIHIFEGLVGGIWFDGWSASIWRSPGTGSPPTSCARMRK